MKEEVSTDNAPRVSGLLSQAVVIKGFVFISGQVHNLPNGTMLSGSIEDKTHQVIKNLKAILEAAKSGLENAVKVTIYVTDMSFGPQVNEVYKSYFNKEPLPAREMVCVKALPLSADIEISLVATTYLDKIK